MGFFSFHIFFLLSFCFFLVLLLLSFSILFSLRLEGSSPRPSRPQLRCTTWVRFFFVFLPLVSFCFKHIFYLARPWLRGGKRGGPAATGKNKQVTKKGGEERGWSVRTRELPRFCSPSLACSGFLSVKRSAYGVISPADIRRYPFAYCGQLHDETEHEA